MGPRQETIDESIVPLRGSRKRGKQKNAQKRLRFDIRRDAAMFGYIALAIGSFCFFFLLSLPLDRLSSHVLQIASTSTQMNWTAETVDVSVIFGPKITLKKLVIAPLPNAPATDLFSRIVGDGIAIDELSFRPSLWQLLPIYGIKESRAAGSFAAELYGAELTGSFGVGRNALDLELEASDLDFKKIPQLASALNIEGMVKSLDFSLSAPRARLGAANGEIVLRADKLKFDPSSLSQAEMIKNLGNLNFGKLDVRARLRNGQLTLNEFQVSGKDSDLEVRLEGDLKLNDNIAYSDMNLVLWLTPSAKLQPLFPLVANFLRMEQKPNNAYATRIQGNFLAPTYTPYKGG